MLDDLRDLQGPVGHLGGLAWESQRGRRRPLRRATRMLVKAMLLLARLAAWVEGVRLGD